MIPVYYRDCSVAAEMTLQEVLNKEDPVSVHVAPSGIMIVWKDLCFAHLEWNQVFDPETSAFQAFYVNGTQVFRAEKKTKKT